jgi:putative Mg2+ transporter-C (MgtC) family protein
MITDHEMIIRLLVGAILGGIIGFERQTHGRPAGLRTHILVCTASVLVMIVSRSTQAIATSDLFRLDPSRLAAGAITGIGFLGAGVIIKSGVTVQGLTTAASIWIVAVMGLAVGGGLYLPALVAFIITVLTLWTLRMIETRMVRHTYKSLTVVLGAGADEEAVKGVLTGRQASVECCDYEIDAEKGEKVLHLTVGFFGQAPLKQIIDGISLLPGVKRVHTRT